MEDFLKLFEGVLESSRAIYGVGDEKSSIRWKHCVILSEAGWKASACEKENETSNNVIITWTKENKKDIKMVLTFQDQCLWITYLENGRKNDIE